MLRIGAPDKAHVGEGIVRTKLNLRDVNSKSVSATVEQTNGTNWWDIVSVTGWKLRNGGFRSTHVAYTCLPLDFGVWVDSEFDGMDFKVRSDWIKQKDILILSLIIEFGKLLAQIWFFSSKMCYFVGWTSEILNFFINKGYNGGYFRISRWDFIE